MCISISSSLLIDPVWNFWCSSPEVAVPAQHSVLKPIPRAYGLKGKIIHHIDSLIRIQ